MPIPAPDQGPVPGLSLPATIAAVRQFNRFYTGRVGALKSSLLGSGFTLTEVRVLHQIRHRSRPTATGVGIALGLDPAQLSRTLQRFLRRQLITRTRGSDDRRHSHLALTPAGRSTIVRLEQLADREVAAMLQPLSPTSRKALLRSMSTVERILSGTSLAAPPPGPIRLRSPKPGDLGWLVHRHGVLYAHEYGWDERFEGLVAEVVADFARGHDPRRERCWMAERDGAVLGCVMLVRHPERGDTARLRILLVEPTARGMGIGRRLVNACTAFARKAGYRTITLWTNSVLHAARKLYQEAGYHLKEERPHDRFGQDLIGQTWELELSPSSKRSQVRSD